VPYDSPKPWLEKPPTPCANEECDAIIIGQATYYAMSKEIREAKGLKPHDGHGLCKACSSRRKRTGSVKRNPNPQSRPHDPNPPFPCARCSRSICNRRGREVGGVGQHAGRGLCWRCYRRSRDDGTLIDYAPRSRRNDDVIEEWLELNMLGVREIREAAPRMGMTIKALDKALYRARKNGVLT
jgi:hypothetical protein